MNIIIYIYINNRNFKSISSSGSDIGDVDIITYIAEYKKRGGEGETDRKN